MAKARPNQKQSFYFRATIVDHGEFYVGLSGLGQTPLETQDMVWRTVLELSKTEPRLGVPDPFGMLDAVKHVGILTLERALTQRKLSHGWRKLLDNCIEPRWVISETTETPQPTAALEGFAPNEAHKHYTIDNPRPFEPEQLTLPDVAVIPIRVPAKLAA